MLCGVAAIATSALPPARPHSYTSRPPCSESTFQGGVAVEVFGANGSNPVANWKVAGSVQKVYEKAVKGYVYRCDGGPSAKMQLPKDDRRSLGLVQPYLVLQLHVPEAKPFSLELSVTDTARSRPPQPASAGEAPTRARPPPSLAGACPPAAALLHLVPRGDVQSAAHASAARLPRARRVGQPDLRPHRAHRAQFWRCAVQPPRIDRRRRRLQAPADFHAARRAGRAARGGGALPPAPAGPPRPPLRARAAPRARARDGDRGRRPFPSSTSPSPGGSSCRGRRLAARSRSSSPCRASSPTWTTARQPVRAGPHSDARRLPHPTPEPTRGHRSGTASTTSVSSPAGVEGSWSEAASDDLFQAGLGPGPCCSPIPYAPHPVGGLSPPRDGRSASDLREQLLLHSSASSQLRRSAALSQAPSTSSACLSPNVRAPRAGSGRRAASVQQASRAPAIHSRARTAQQLETRTARGATLGSGSREAALPHRAAVAAAPAASAAAAACATGPASSPSGPSPRLPGTPVSAPWIAGARGGGGGLPSRLQLGPPSDRAVSSCGSAEAIDGAPLAPHAESAPSWLAQSLFAQSCSSTSDASSAAAGASVPGAPLGSSQLQRKHAELQRRRQRLQQLEESFERQYGDIHNATRALSAAGLSPDAPTQFGRQSPPLPALGPCRHDAPAIGMHPGARSRGAGASALDASDAAPPRVWPLESPAAPMCEASASAMASTAAVPQCMAAAWQPGAPSHHRQAHTRGRAAVSPDGCPPLAPSTAQRATGAHAVSARSTPDGAIVGPGRSGVAAAPPPHPANPVQPPGARAGDGSAGRGGRSGGGAGVQRGPGGGGGGVVPLSALRIDAALTVAYGATPISSEEFPPAAQAGGSPTQHLLSRVKAEFGSAVSVDPSPRLAAAPNLPETFSDGDGELSEPDSLAAARAYLGASHGPNASLAHTLASSSCATADDARGNVAKDGVGGVRAGLLPGGAHAADQPELFSDDEVLTSAGGDDLDEVTQARRGRWGVGRAGGGARSGGGGGVGLGAWTASHTSLPPTSRRFDATH